MGSLRSVKAKLYLLITYFTGEGLWSSDLFVLDGDYLVGWNKILNCYQKPRAVD